MDALIQLLITCEALLRKVGEEFWAEKLLRIVQQSSGSFDMNLIENIISSYGGMGSFNDLIISRHNDHRVETKDEDRLNNELDKLRNAIYQEAVRLQRLER